MPDQQTDTEDVIEDQLDTLRDRIDALEERVSDLEATGKQATPGVIDRYDGYVLNKIEELGREPTARHVVQLYQEAGVRDKSKIKQRHKFLKTTGRIDSALKNASEA